jgi:hypothetical protein
MNTNSKTNNICLPPPDEIDGAVSGQKDSQKQTFAQRHKSQVRATIRLGGGRIISDEHGLGPSDSNFDFDRPSAFTSNNQDQRGSKLYPREISPSGAPTLLSKVFNMSTIPNVIRI